MMCCGWSVLKSTRFLIFLKAFVHQIGLEAKKPNIGVECFYLLNQSKKFSPPQRFPREPGSVPVLILQSIIICFVAVGWVARVASGRRYKALPLAGIGPVAGHLALTVPDSLRESSVTDSPNGIPE